MKTLKHLDFSNMALISRYLSGELTVTEKLDFERRLKTDPVLQEDYFYVKNAYRQNEFQITSNYLIRRKGNTGRQLLQLGSVILFGTVLLVLCTAVFSYFLL